MNVTKRFGWMALGVPLLALAIASWAGPPVGVSADSKPIPLRPTAEEVLTVLTKDSTAPARHTLTELTEKGVAPRSDVVIWTRHFDGIEMLDRPSTVLREGRWETHHRRELAEPAPARLASVLPMETALKLAGVAKPEQATTRLVYLPEYRDLPKVDNVQNAMDVETVIAEYRLAIEVVDGARRSVVWLDAYDGAVLNKGSLDDHLVVTVSGRLYSPVSLDVTPVAGGNQLRDTTRFGWTTSDGIPILGQGVVSQKPDPLDQASYVILGSTDPALIDAAFALQQSWDFFAGAFGRRGPHNIPPSILGVGNEALLYLDPSSSDLQASIDPATGLIRIPSGNSGWRAFATLEVLSHEWAHAVFYSDVTTDFQIKKGEQAGINEANSNFFGLMIGMRGRAVLANPANVPQIVAVPDTAADWIFADEDTYPAGFDALPYHLCMPSRGHPDGEGPLNAWLPAIGNVDGHDAAGPINRMHCLLSRGILSSSSQGGDPDLRSDDVPNGFSGLGSVAVTRLWYQALTFMRGHSPVMFADARQAMLDSAVVFYGKYSDAYKAVEDAFAAIKVGLTADRNPPAVALSWSIARAAASMPVDVSDENGVESLAFYLDGDPANPDAPGTLIGTLSAPAGIAIAPPYFVTFPQQTTGGDHALTIVARDTHKNTQSYHFFHITIDNTPPDLTVTDRTASLPSGSHSTLRVFDFSASDAWGISKAQVLVDGVDSTYPSSGNLGGQLPGPTVYNYPSAPSISETRVWVLLMGSPSGTHVVSVKVTDVAGNSTTKDLPPFVRETNPPFPCSVTATRNASGWRNVSLAALTLDVGSSISKVKYIIDGQTALIDADATLPPGAPYSKTKLLTAPDQPGIHTFKIQCIDQQGNSAYSNPVSLTLSPPPTCALSASLDSGGTHANIIVLASSAGSKLQQVEYDVDASPVATDTGPFPASGLPYTATRVTGVLAPGNHTIQLHCTDQLSQTTLSNAVTLNVAPGCTGPHSDSDGSYYFFPEDGDTHGVTTQYYYLGRTSGHFKWVYGWLSGPNISYTVSCADGGTVNGSSSYSTGCVQPGTYPFPPSFAQDASFNCTNGKIKVVANPGCNNLGGYWSVEVWCGKP